MPSGKQDAITVSFSEKNKDVYNLLLENKNKIGKSFNQNDFVCESIRFYIKNKDKSFNDLDEYRVKLLIDEKLKEFQRSLETKETSLDLVEEEIPILADGKTLEDTSKNLGADAFEED